MSLLVYGEAEIRYRPFNKFEVLFQLADAFLRVCGHLKEILPHG
jgi:hypothetical protein